MSYLVRTEKQIAALLAKLEAANAAIAIVHADLTGEVAQVVENTRKPRQAKAVAASDAPVATKKRGRPPKAAVQTTIADASEV